EVRREILADPWRLRDFMDERVDETVPGMRHILLHLLHPETFERIASGAHKQSIASTYGDLVGGTNIEDIDERLLAIRRRLEELLGKPSDELDFYEAPSRQHGVQVSTRTEPIRPKRSSSRDSSSSSVHPARARLMRPGSWPRGSSAGTLFASGARSP